MICVPGPDLFLFPFPYPDLSPSPYPDLYPDLGLCPDPGAVFLCLCLFLSPYPCLLTYDRKKSMELAS